MKVRFDLRCRVLSGAILAGFVALSSGSMAAPNLAAEVAMGIGPLQHEVSACSVSQGEAPSKNKHCQPQASPE
jgi:hypothetical protein